MMSKPLTPVSFDFSVVKGTASLYCLVSIERSEAAIKVPGVLWLLSHPLLRNLTSRDVFHLGDLVFLGCFSLSRIHDH